MTTESGANPLQYISEMNEMVEQYEFVDDLNLAACMDLTVKLLMKEEINPARIAKVIKDLGAYSALFRWKYVYYMGIGKGSKDAALKKNIFRSSYEATDRLADCLKYLAKV